MSIRTVAIIGAGLAGQSLAVFLKRQGLAVTIYELREPGARTEGAVMLSPNALRTLDALGVYARLRPQGYSFRDLHFRTNKHAPLDAYEMGNAARYGYDALRVYRRHLQRELTALLVEAGVPVAYGRKFSHVVSETAAEGVRFAFADGVEATADLLVGADGIHSAVRAYLHPGVEPVFGGIMAVTGAAPTAAIAFPSPTYGLPSSTHGKAGGFVIAPQDAAGSEALVGTQYRTHARDRAGWEALARNKAGLLSILRERYDDWNPMVQSAMDAVPVESMSMWAFHTVPNLETWASEQGRVVMLGDAAHAIPPAAGQGVNQAFEDSHALALVLNVVRSRESSGVDMTATWLDGVHWWQTYRLNRVKRIQALTDEMNRRRMPGWDGKGDPIDSSWLFDVQIAEDVASWAARKADQ